MMVKLQVTDAGQHLVIKLFKKDDNNIKEVGPLHKFGGMLAKLAILVDQGVSLYECEPYGLSQLLIPRLLNDDVG